MQFVQSNSFFSFIKRCSVLNDVFCVFITSNVFDYMYLHVYLSPLLACNKSQAILSYRKFATATEHDSDFNYKM